MAAVALTEYYAHGGAVWARVVALWDLYTGDVALTWVSSAYAATLNSKSMIVVITDAVNTTTYTLIDVNTANTSMLSVGMLHALDGFDKTPQAWSPAASARVTATEFTGKLVVARRTMVGGWCVATAQALVTYTLTNILGSTLTTTVCVSTYTNRSNAYTDTYCLLCRVNIAGHSIPANANISVGYQAGNHTSNSETVALDLAEVVAALQDVARRDVATAIDNGKITVYSFSGDIVESP